MKSFEIFYTQTNKKIYNFLIRILRNELDAQDVMQESYIRIFPNYAKLENPNAYLYKVSYHTALEYIKKNKKKETLQKQFLEQNPHQATYHTDKVEGKNFSFEQLMQSLPKKYQLAIQLKSVEKKSYKQIAQIMGISQKAVESILVRARRILKSELKKMQEKSPKILFSERRTNEVPV